MVVGVEIVNILVLFALDSFSEIVTNFTALVIISEFDDFFFEASLDDETKAVVSGDKEAYAEMIMVRMTTSSDAKANTNQNLVTKEFFEKEGKVANGKIPEHIRVKFGERSAINMIMFTLYRLLRLIYVSFWYYFIPYATIVGSVLYFKKQ